MSLALIPVIAAASSPDPVCIDAADGDEIVMLIDDQASSHEVPGYEIGQPLQVEQTARERSEICRAFLRASNRMRPSQQLA